MSWPPAMMAKASWYSLQISFISLFPLGLWLWGDRTGLMTSTLKTRKQIQRGRALANAAQLRIDSQACQMTNPMILFNYTPDCLFYSTWILPKSPGENNLTVKLQPNLGNPSGASQGWRLCFVVSWALMSVTKPSRLASAFQERGRGTGTLPPSRCCWFFSGAGLLLKLRLFLQKHN